jgi:hypothetical protein
LRNGGFETDSNADTRPDTWTTDATFTRSSAQVHGGSFSGQFTATTNVNVIVKQSVTVTAGNAYAVSGFVNVPATSDTFSLKVQVQWRGGGATLSTSTVSTISAATSGWASINATLTAPAGATSAFLMLNASSLGNTIYVDDFSFG